MCCLCQGAARARLPGRGVELGAQMAPGGMCAPQHHNPPRGPKAQAEQGLLWGPLTVPNTASDELGLGRVWVPAEASCGQEGVLEPPEKMHGLFKLSEGNSNALEKKW